MSIDAFECHKPNKRSQLIFQAKFRSEYRIQRSSTFFFFMTSHLLTNFKKIRNLAQTFQVEPVSFLQNCDNLMALVLAQFYFPEVLNFGILFLRPLSLQAKQKLVTMGPKMSSKLKYLNKLTFISIKVRLLSKCQII